MTISTLLILAVCMSYMNLGYSPALQKSVVAQWLEHSTGVQNVIGSNPVGYSVFFGSFYVSGKLPTYVSPKPAFCLKWELRVNVGLGGGLGGQFPRKVKWSDFSLSSARDMLITSLLKNPSCILKLNTHTIIFKAQRNWKGDLFQPFTLCLSDDNSLGGGSGGRNRWSRLQGSWDWENHSLCPTH